VATQSLTRACWIEPGQGHGLYTLGQLASTNDLTSRHGIGEDVLNRPYFHPDQWNSPARRSSAHASTYLPVTPATDDDRRPTQDLLQPFKTPGPPPVSGRARNDAIILANIPQLPFQAHTPASTEHNGSPLSGNSPESPFTAQVDGTKSRPARYRATPSASSTSPLSRNRLTAYLSMPNVSPLSEYGSRPVSSSRTAGTRSENRQQIGAGSSRSGSEHRSDVDRSSVGYRALGISCPSSTLFHNKTSRHPRYSSNQKYNCSLQRH
jgi:hypothetical protein